MYAPMVAFVLGCATLTAVGVLAVGIPSWRARRHGGKRSILLSAVLLGATATLLVVTLAVLGVVVPDRIDNMQGNDRRIAESALSDAFGCADWPLTRVTAVTVREEGAAVHWSCAWTIVGWPRFSGTARCAEGQWTSPGVWEPRTYGSC